MYCIDFHVSSLTNRCNKKSNKKADASRVYYFGARMLLVDHQHMLTSDSNHVQNIKWKCGGILPSFHKNYPHSLGKNYTICVHDITLSSANARAQHAH